jgi:glycosyltransferase involved in cell wall biosynthesis
MLRVTFCIYDEPDSVGGPVTWVQRLLPSLRDHGIDARCLFLLHWGDTGPALAALRREGFDCQAVLAHERTEDRVRWILDRLRENPPDVFVPNLVVAGYFAARWAREAGIPTVGVLHADGNIYRGLQTEFVFGAEAFRVSAVVCVSRELERQVLARRPAATLVRRIPYGVPVPPTKVERTPQTLRIAFVGRLAEEQKRISDVTRALCKSVRDVPGTEAVIYGDGPDRAAVERILATEGRGLDVRLKGRIASEEVQQRLLNCDVIVLLSDYEGLPIALMEAMACGCVPVCLRIRSGIPELVRDGVTGLLVDDRGEDFVRAIRRLRDDPGLWQSLSAAARASIAASFSDTQSAAQWAGLIHHLHGASGAKRTIRIPRRLSLPSVNPGLASADLRATAPPMAVRIYRRGRMFAGRVKRRLLGTPAPEPSEKTHRIVLKKAIIMRIDGGLASQMLCYKAARYIADLKGSSIIMDATLYEGSDDSNRNFQLMHYDIKYDLMVFSDEVLNHIKACNDIAYITRDMLPGPLAPDAGKVMDYILSQDIVHCDFWLSMFVRREMDLHAERNGILDELTLRYDKVFNERDYACLDLIRTATNPVAIHVRRGDFQTHGGGLLLTSEYYNRSIQALENRVEDPVFLVFSDDMEWCRRNLRSRSALHFADFNDERHAFKDMYLASQCRHFILSNESTFSHQIVQLSERHENRIVITSTQNDLVRSSRAPVAVGE